MTAAAALLPTSASAQGNTGNSRSMNSMENDLTAAAMSITSHPLCSAWVAFHWEMNLP